MCFLPEPIRLIHTQKTGVLVRPWSGSALRWGLSRGPRPGPYARSHTTLLILLFREVASQERGGRVESGRTCRDTASYVLAARGPLLSEDRGRGLLSQLSQDRSGPEDGHARRPRRRK